MENCDINIEVVYNGLIAKLFLNKKSVDRVQETKPLIETFVFKNINEFMDWYDKNMSTPKRSKEFIFTLLKRRTKKDDYYKIPETSDRSWSWLNSSWNKSISTPTSYSTSIGTYSTTGTI